MIVSDFRTIVANTKEISDKEVERLFVAVEMKNGEEAGEVLDLLHNYRPELAKKLML